MSESRVQPGRAVSRAATEKAEGRYQPALDLDDGSVDSQSDEIDVMQSILG